MSLMSNVKFQGQSMEFRSAKAKIERARELIAEIEALLIVEPAYTYCLETNIQTGQRATFAKSNQNALNKIVIRCGEVLHNLRSSLDHAYWESVSPHVQDESKHGAIQFPFAKDGSKLESAIKSRLAHLVSQDFYQAIERLKPNAGHGGNLLLNLLHEINIVDKHKFPTPVGDYTKISSDQIINQVPDFPRELVNCSFGQNGYDVVWTGRMYDIKSIGDIVKPTTCIFHKTLNVPVDLMFSIKEPRYYFPVGETLKNMAEEVDKILIVMRDALPK